MKDSLLVLFWGAWYQTTTGWQPLLTKLGAYDPVIAWHDERADQGLVWPNSVVETFSSVIVIDERDVLVNWPPQWIVWQGRPGPEVSAATLSRVVNHTYLLLERRQGGIFRLADFIVSDPHSW